MFSILLILNISKALYLISDFDILLLKISLNKIFQFNIEKFILPTKNNSYLVGFFILRRLYCSELHIATMSDYESEAYIKEKIDTHSLKNELKTKTIVKYINFYLFYSCCFFCFLVLLYFKYFYPSWA